MVFLFTFDSCRLVTLSTSLPTPKNADIEGHAHGRQWQYNSHLFEDVVQIGFIQGVLGETFKLAASLKVNPLSSPTAANSSLPPGGEARS